MVISGVIVPFAFVIFVWINLDEIDFSMMALALIFVVEVLWLNIVRIWMRKTVKSVWPIVAAMLLLFGLILYFYFEPQPPGSSRSRLSILIATIELVGFSLLNASLCVRLFRGKVTKGTPPIDEW